MSEMIVHCSHEERVPIGLMKPNPRNTNKHPEQQIKMLAKILEYQGWRHPIIVSKLSGLVCAGHGRLEAAKLNGWTEVPVDFQDFENEKQELLYLVSDNKIAEISDNDPMLINEIAASLGDFDLDLLGIPDFEMIEPEVIGECDEDEIPVDAETRCKPGDIWRLGAHRLMCGDSTSIDAVEKLMTGERADMVFTDPPYGINEQTDRAFASPTRLTKGNTFKKIAGDESTDCAKDACNLLLALDIQTMVIWGGNYFCHSLPEQGNWLVWDKREEDKERDFNSDCELAWACHPHRPSVRIFRHKWKGMIKASEHGQARVHPTQKPIALAEWCFQELGPDSKSILDLFGGSGSTLIACEKTNRKCFMMELDPHYCDVIIARYEKFSGRIAERITDGDSIVEKQSSRTAVEVQA